MLIAIRTLGDIREGDVYIKINGKDHRVFPNIEVNNNLCYEGVIEVEGKVLEVIARVEKDGIVIDEYNIGEQQCITKFNEAERVNFNGLNPNEKPHMGWLYQYCGVLQSSVGMAELQAVPHEAFLGLQHLEKVYNYYEKNNKDAKLLKLAIEIIKEYAGWEGLY